MLSHTPLGKKSPAISHYQRDLLCPIPRNINRERLGIKTLPFTGFDIWNAYELSWLSSNGKPEIACAQFHFPCESPQLIESKSFKLYLNSFNNTKFASQDVSTILIHDLSEAAGMPVEVKLISLNDVPQKIASHFTGLSLDKLDITCDTYEPLPSYLITEENIITETLCSDLLRSNCPVTGQPDWGSIQITYTGEKINHEGLLKYIISYRKHTEFHEHCVEKMFVDIMQYCNPEKLLIYARFTRRGGLDINPYRANYPIHIDDIRLWRQ